MYSQDKDPTTGLTRNQRAVLAGLTGQGGPKKTQLQIAADLGISRQRVHQITKDLIQKGYKI